MPASAIHTFTFISMSAPPVAPQQNVSLETRAGVPGVTAWATGIQGLPFQVQTVRDVVNFATAESVARQYQSLTGAGPVTITYGGILLPYKVLVLKVTPTEVAQTLLGVGGVNGLSRGVVRATWELISWVQI